INPAGANRPGGYTVPATTRVRKSGVSHHHAPTLRQRLATHTTTARCYVPAALLAGAALASCKTAPPPPPPPPAVVVAPVDVRDTPVQAEFTGEARGGEDLEGGARD